MKPIQLCITVLLSSLFFFSSISAKAQVDPSAYANGFMAELILNEANKVIDIRPAPEGVFNDTIMLQRHFIVAMQVREEFVILMPIGRKAPRNLVFGRVGFGKQALGIPNKYWKFPRNNFITKAGKAIYLPRVKRYKVLPAS